ncbi:PspC domain-containing protein [Pisciglobus halotolerans]|uniref:Phage shock protein PspC (Stress-responsive transcriptional regulator) n=1 Tax=Pisciglobus halotolerans TaxID=745365 RepID=A0A1I3BK84_9LACT|nr:PspC domain-containing protein [Pisciglobus halotolerans]SFH62516.1 Phage shock protein PspC (stress-responsive transcriptional regulator) [Pisciglobus halotolerans]
MKKLTKSRNDRMVSGVLGGIAEYFGIDSTLVRIVYAIAILFGYGAPVVLYIVLAILMPEPTSGQSPYRNRNYSGYYKNQREKKRKEAEKVDKDDDNWSDF